MNDFCALFADQIGAYPPKHPAIDRFPIGLVVVAYFNSLDAMNSSRKNADLVSTPPR